VTTHDDVLGSAASVGRRGPGHQVDERDDTEKLVDLPR
jgi:hypothetical protein